MKKLFFELNTPVDDGRPVFLTGSFCDWYPDVPDLQMQQTGPGKFALELPIEVPEGYTFEYKYTRGGWDHVELNHTGEGIPNRFFPDQYTYQLDHVPHWRWFGQPFNPDFLPKLELLSETVEMPQLETTRRVQVLLPHDYDSSDKNYPVLYLHDGQNLFGAGVGFGSWAIDQKMAILAHRHRHEVILVSIDHGEEERLREFSPYKTQFGRGKGREYINFIVHTLKPQIDAQYRTLTDPSHTGIGGSSMGGLISIYAGLIYPSIFGRLMIFSPSLWVSPKIYFDAIRFHSPSLTKLYLYGGEKESTYMVPNMKRLQEALSRQGYESQEQAPWFQVSIDPIGTHEEAHWSREFPKAVEWLFFK